jgi:hypothetical protein
MPVNLRALTGSQASAENLRSPRQETQPLAKSAGIQE